MGTAIPKHKVILFVGGGHRSPSLSEVVLEPGAGGGDRNTILPNQQGSPVRHTEEPALHDLGGRGRGS